MVQIGAAIGERVLAVTRQAQDAAISAGRSPDSITVIAVSKTASRAQIDEAYAAGIRHFGENRVQDATAKLAVPLPADATLHMIGQLQTNKANVAARLFGVVQSVDRPSLIAELDKQAAWIDRVLSVLLQVNVAGEAQKAGCAPGEARELARLIAGSAHLRLDGLMTMAPLVDDPEEVRFVFRGLRELRDRLREAGAAGELPVLSMGMSNDFPVAIAEGATHVRIGRAVFG